MEINQCRVYDLEEAIVASGFPKLTAYDDQDFDSAVSEVSQNIKDGVAGRHILRAARLAKAPDGSGHKTFLSGVLVAMNITATMKWWVQFGRYHFQQIDSSMSTMHKLKKMVENNTIRFHPATDPQVISEFTTLCMLSDDIEEIAYSVPAGIELTARVNTNYLQLTTMVKQRGTHRLGEWKQFCDHVRTLPMADILIFTGDDDGGGTIKPGLV